VRVAGSVQEGGGEPHKRSRLTRTGSTFAAGTTGRRDRGEPIATEAAVDSMSGYKANAVTLTVGGGLSGQIIQFVAGAATDAEGDVVAGADVAAATTD
jgi:hypothetical protein